MPIDRSLIKQIRGLDEFDLRRLQIFIRGLLVDDGGEATGSAGAVTYRQELVRCGKAGCRSCPHGPYWYAYWREDGRVRSRYIGRRLPDQPPPGPTAPSRTS
ncbi:MAG: hypothetical protein ACRDKW_02365 [Actinomycetota bacterium]